MQSSQPIAAHDRDTVTGLADLDGTVKQVGQWLARGAPVHAMLVGLKRLDAVNLAYGKAGGNVLLAETAARLRNFAQEELANETLVARGPAASFLIATVEACSRERWQSLATRLLAILGLPVVVGGAQVRLTPRAVLMRAIAADDGQAFPVAALETALDRLAAQSKSRIAWFDGAAVRSGRDEAMLDADLLHALERGEIEVLFQPQVACADGRIVGAEALARWQHPRLGRIGASTLFAVAERADQQVTLAAHIAAKAMAEAAGWPDHVSLSLNLTPHELTEPDCVGRIVAALDAGGLAPGRLTLEVTEQALIEDVENAAGTLAALRSLGIRTALDDFGAGFCNFGYLKLLGLDYLKLDRSMIEGAVDDGRDRSVLRAIIAMARALDLKVIAEGVETPTQRELVAKEGCHAWQGFLMAMPLGIEEFQALIGVAA